MIGAVSFVFRVISEGLPFQGIAPKPARVYGLSRIFSEKGFEAFDKA
jgi:hypothetical protein